MKFIIRGYNKSYHSFELPQGSVLGPILFTLFTAPLEEVCRKHGINFQSYADDQENYLSFKSSNTNSIAKCKQSLEACIKDIGKWMRTNKLKLTDEKDISCPFLHQTTTGKTRGR